MLRSLKPLRQYTIMADDGSIGRVYDFYFHDDTWAVRYMVVDTGHLLSGRKVLVSTEALGAANWDAHTFPVALTLEQIKQSPEIDTDKPVSRQQEAQLHAHFGWPHYWTKSAAQPAGMAKGDSHLRSVREVTGYRIHANDGDLGRVKDFIVDDTQWIIRYLVVDLSVWMPTKKVLISPHWLSEINFVRRRVTVNMAQESIVNSPEFHPTAAVNRAYEEKLYDYYGRPIDRGPRAHQK